MFLHPLAQRQLTRELILGIADRVHQAYGPIQTAFDDVALRGPHVGVVIDDGPEGPRVEVLRDGRARPTPLPKLLRARTRRLRLDRLPNENMAICYCHGRIMDCVQRASFNFSTTILLPLQP